MKTTEPVLVLSSECKNCGQPLSSLDKFCSNCAGKVVSKRITFKNLMTDLFRNTLGWDNKYIFTIKRLLIKPGDVLSEYINGTRKKYVHPFTFLAIGMTIAIFIFNSFDTEYISANQEFQKSQLEWMAETIGGPYKSPEFRQEQLQNNEKIVRYQLKYFNIIVVLFLPIYAFIAFLVYRKPYNYGEHIVVNSYVQGMSFISISILFLIGLVTHPLVYTANFILLICFYTYAYGKLYKLSFWQSIFKVFIFFSILIGGLFAIGLISYIIGYLVAKLTS